MDDCIVVAAVDNHIHIHILVVGGDYIDLVDSVVVDIHIDSAVDNYIHIDIVVADNIDSAAATLMHYHSIELEG